MDKRSFQGDLILVFQYLRQFITRRKRDFLIWADSGRTRGSGFKLQENRFRLDVRKKSFSQRVMTGTCFSEVLDAPSL